jgi:hypothetical protein
MSRVKGLQMLNLGRAPRVRACTMARNSWPGGAGRREPTPNLIRWDQRQQ